MKIFLFKFILVSVVFLLTGCVTQPMAKPTIINVPKLNTVSTAEVGQNMYEKIYAVYENEKIVEFLDKEVKEKYLANEEKYHIEVLDNNQCALFKDNRQTNLLDSKCNGSFDMIQRRGRLGFQKIGQLIKYRIVENTRIHVVKSSYKYEVLYQGKIDNKLNISFREFVAVKGSFLIKDAFTQNIQYQMDENGEAMIGFKGLRIKVMKATNFDITYKVLKGYK